MFGISGDKQTANQPRRDSTIQREAYFLDYAQKIKAAINTPFAVTGGFRSASAMNSALVKGNVDMIGIARPFCVDPDLPKKLILGEIEQLPSFETTLQLGKGMWGVNSPYKLIKILNVQAQVAWFSGQIARLSHHQEPLLTAGLKRSLFRQMALDVAISLKRQSIPTPVTAQ